MDLRDDPQGLLISAIQESIEPVYRYHLARSDDYFEAQTLTVSTLTDVVKWLSAHRRVHQNDLMMPIMVIARSQQAFGSRHGFPTGFKPKNLTVTDLDHENDPKGRTNYDPYRDDPFGIDLAEVSLRNQIAGLSRSWKQLPRQQADALALHYFAGLDLPQVAQILKKSEGDIKRLVAGQAALESEIIGLAGSLHPDRVFVEYLKAYLLNTRPTTTSTLRKKIDRYVARSGATLRKIVHSSQRLVQIGTLVGILALGLVVIMNQPSAGSPRITPTAADATNAPVLKAAINNRGNLVPPALAVCQQWQTALSRTTGQNISLSESAFVDPFQTGPRSNGTSCLLEATVSTGDNGGAWPVFNSISQLFSANRFIQQTALDRYTSFGGPAYFGPDCFGMGKTLANNTVRVILSISWCPASSSGKNLEIPAPPFNGQISANVEWMAHNLSPFTLKVFLASNTVESMLENVFNQWSDGSNQVISYLSPDLLKRFPTLALLDQLAGIDRQNIHRVIFDWDVVDNSGTALRLAVTPRDVTSDGLHQSMLNQFQVSLVQVNGNWQIKDMGKTVPFS